MAPYRNSPPPDWAGWSDDSLYYPRSDPLSGGDDPGEDYGELTAPELSAPPRSTTPFGQFLPSLLDAVARRPQPVPPGQFLASIGVHLPPPQSVLGTRPFHPPPPPTLMVQPLPAQDAILDDALLEPWPATGPALPGEDITGFGTTAPRVPAEFERTRGDGIWRNATAGAGEHVYGRVGTYVDPAIEMLNGGISGLNALAGTDIGRLPPASRWVAENAEEYLGVPDPEHTQAITPGEKAARLSGNAAAYLVELLLTRGRGLPGSGLPGGPPPGGGAPGGGPPGRPGPTTPRLPTRPGTLFDDARDLSKLGADLIRELGSTAPRPPRSLNKAGGQLTGGVAEPGFGALQGILHGAGAIRDRAAPLVGGSAADDAPRTGAVPSDLRDAKQSFRLQYVGRTPDKFSRTGAEVVERMRGEGLISGEGPPLRGNPNNLMLLSPDGKWTRIYSTIDMAHKTHAVIWWNEAGRFTGPKSREVRQFMLDSNNYILRPSFINRAEGPRLQQTYLQPSQPERVTVRRKQ
jgi:hypothetical protein